jgi:hypothetical protein
MFRARVSRRPRSMFLSDGSVQSHHKASITRRRPGHERRVRAPAHADGGRIRNVHRIAIGANRESGPVFAQAQVRQGARRASGAAQEGGVHARGGHTSVMRVMVKRARRAASRPTNARPRLEQTPTALLIPGRVLVALEAPSGGGSVERGGAPGGSCRSLWQRSDD